MASPPTIYCPILPKKQLEKHLAAGRYRYDQDGELEKLCANCNEYWPADTEFFFPQYGKGGGLHCYCKACYAERYPRRGWRDAANSLKEAA